MDPHAPQFTLAMIADSIQGLNDNLLQSWITRKVVTLQQRNPGRGQRRLFSFHEALQVELLHHMTGNGVVTKIAGPVSLACASFYCDTLLNKLGYDPSEPYTSDGMYIAVYKSTPKLECKFTTVANFNMELILSVNFSVLQFHYCAWRLHTTIFEVKKHHESS